MGLFLESRLSFFLILAIAGFVAYDINGHDGFKGSRTGVFLRESGALQYGELAFSKFRSCSQQAYRWSQKNIPVYISYSRESVLVYLVTARDLLISLASQLWLNISFILEYFLDKKPVAVRWLNQNIPGLVDTVSDWLSKGWSLMLQYIMLAIKWLKDNIFIGSLSL